MNDLIPKSKKVRVFLATVVMLVLNAKGYLHLSEGTVQLLTGIACAYCIGQGVADSGKEKAKIDAASAAAKPPPVIINAAAPTPPR